MLPTDWHDHDHHTILVVDDDPLIQRMLIRTLQRDQHQVLLASTAQEALDTITSRQICCVLTDLNLPDMDGIRLCRRIRQATDSATVPVILITGDSDPHNLQRGLIAGVGDYIKKPFDPDELRLRIQNQIRLHDTQERQRVMQSEMQLISDAAHDAIILVNERSRIIHWNLAAQRMFGYTREEALGRMSRDLIAPRRFQSQRAQHFASFRELHHRTPTHNTFEFTMRHKDGHEFPVDLSLSSAMLNGKWHAIGILRDITARRAQERQVSQSRKLEAVGQLAAGIAHEINTPTQFVGDSLEFLREAFEDYLDLRPMVQQALEAMEQAGLEPDLLASIRESEDIADLDFLAEQGPAAFERARDGLQRISTIVRAMKEFSHPDQGQKAPADINRAIQATLTIARSETKYVADIETDLDDLPPVLCQLGDLNQVFLNLIVNAAHAIADVVGDSGRRGTIRVRSRLEEDAIRIEIEDTGGGIPVAIQDRVFDPFFTTKEVGRGTGQGLSIARAMIVDKHHGTLSFKSTPGQGTTFIIRLPITTSQREAA